MRLFRWLALLSYVLNGVHNVRLARKPLDVEKFGNEERATLFWWITLLDALAAIAAVYYLLWKWNDFRWRNGIFLIILQVLIGTSIAHVLKFALTARHRDVFYATWLSLWLKGGAFLLSKFSAAKLSLTRPPQTTTAAQRGANDNLSDPSMIPEDDTEEHASGDFCEPPS